MKEAGAGCKVSGVHLMTFQVTCMGAPNMEAVYALAARSERPAPTGLGEGDDIQPEPVIFTHGRNSGVPGDWSEKTNELLKELIDSMEQDLIPKHFNTTKEALHARTELGAGEEAGQI